MTGCLDIYVLLHNLCYQLVPYFKSHTLILCLGLLPSACIVFYCMLTAQCILQPHSFFTDNTPCSMYYILDAKLSLWSQTVHCTKQYFVQMANGMVSHWLASHSHSDVSLIVTAAHTKHAMINMATKCDSVTLRHVCVCVCVCVYIYIYIYIFRLCSDNHHHRRLNVR